MPQLDPTHFPSQLFWLVICFGALVLFMRFWAVPRIQDILHERHQQVEGKLVRIQSLQAKIEAIEAQQEKLAKQSTESITLKLQEAETRRQKILQENEATLKKMVEEEVEKIKVSLDKKETEILKELRQNKSDFVATVLHQIADTSTQKEDT